MLKLPFIERTLVGIELTDQHLYWVELNKLSNRIEVIGSGEISILESVEQALDELKSQIQSDAHYLGCASRQVQKEIQVYDAPFFEDVHDLQKWVTTQTQDIETGSELSYISTHLISVGEEENRLVIQIHDDSRIEQMISIFKEADQSLLYVSNGVIEGGYSQIFNPEFLDSYSGVISRSNNGHQLLIFFQGRIFNMYELPETEYEEEVLASADSILRSEEVTLELAENSIPCFYQFSSIDANQYNRPLILLEPYFNKGRNLLPATYATAAGVALKMCYPELDTFEILEEREKEDARFNYDKTELLRTAVLLFVPLVVFVLIAFAVNKWTEPKLNEVSQISAIIGDRLDMISDERDASNELKNEFDILSRQYSETYITAPIFEVLAASVPENVWLEEVQIGEDGQVITTLVEGVALASDLITQFIQSIRKNDTITSVRLLSSEKQSSVSRNQEQILFSIQISSLK